MLKWIQVSVISLGGCLLVGCQSGESPQKVGQLQVKANGEDFVRQTFTSQDSWQISFNHVYVIFGDGEQPPDDQLNVKALGFEPLAALADGQTLQADWATLTQKLEPEQLKTLETALLGLGHVGEGHCRAEALS